MDGWSEHVIPQRRKTARHEIYAPDSHNAVVRRRKSAVPTQNPGFCRVWTLCLGFLLEPLRASARSSIPLVCGVVFFLRVVKHLTTFGIKCDVDRTGDGISPVPPAEKVYFPTAIRAERGLSGIVCWLLTNGTNDLLNHLELSGACWGNVFSRCISWPP